MMRFSELADRYARAIYEIAVEAKIQDRIFAELRELEGLLSKENAIREFLNSPVTKATEKEQVLKVALKNSGLTPDAVAFALLLAAKNRLSLFGEIVQALQVHSDEAHGVTRGAVRSAVVLGPEDRKRVEDIVGRFTKKQVILSYKEDSSLIGGLIAEVGSFTFDDTLTSHLRRMKEEITRRAN